MQRTIRLVVLPAIMMFLVLLIGPAGASWAPASPQTSPCAPGGVYDAACDVDHDGDVDIFDIQLAAGHWNQSGTWSGGDFWALTGNAGTAAGAHFLGTTDLEPLELRVAGLRALRLEPVPLPPDGAPGGGSQTPNLIGGHEANAVTPYVQGAAIGGGGSALDPNQVLDDFGAIGGGAYNRAGDGLGTLSDRAYATVGGGKFNAASGGYATVSGGTGNTASGFGATVAGGDDNNANGFGATVGGGGDNGASGDFAVVNGGGSNSASGEGATVGGGVYHAAGGDYAVVSGGESNSASSFHATVSGGIENDATGDQSTVGGGYFNQANATNATVGGGYLNLATHTSATVAGGSSNTASGDYATIAGGRSHTVNGNYAAVGGGYLNLAGGAYATVAGGVGNSASNARASVAGGANNEASGDSATVAGGAFNRASGDYSFAAGRRAKADHAGAFVWADATDADFVSTANNQFLLRAAGGVGINTNAPNAMLAVDGGNSVARIAVNSNTPTANAGLSLRQDGVNRWAIATVFADGDLTIFREGAGGGSRLFVDGGGANAGYVGIGNAAPQYPLHMASGAHVTAGGTWTNASSRQLKTDFAAIDRTALLAKLADLPVSAWSYRAEDAAVRHLGPTAEDFYAAFQLGRDNGAIATVDADGVALAAIQELQRLNQAQQAQLAGQQQQIERLEARLAALEQRGQPDWSPWLLLASLAAWLLLATLAAGLLLRTAARTGEIRQST